MSTSFAISDVAKIKVKTDHDVCMKYVYWKQTIEAYDRKGFFIGSMTLCFENIKAVLPIENIPPYWRLDLANPADLQVVPEFEEEID